MFGLESLNRVVQVKQEAAILIFPQKILFFSPDRHPLGIEKSLHHKHHACMVGQIPKHGVWRDIFVSGRQKRLRWRWARNVNVQRSHIFAQGQFHGRIQTTTGSRIRLHAMETSWETQDALQSGGVHQTVQPPGSLRSWRYVRCLVGGWRKAMGWSRRRTSAHSTGILQEWHLKVVRGQQRHLRELTSVILELSRSYLRRWCIQHFCSVSLWNIFTAGLSVRHQHGRKIGQSLWIMKGTSTPRSLQCMLLKGVANKLIGSWLMRICDNVRSYQYSSSIDSDSHMANTQKYIFLVAASHLFRKKKVVSKMQLRP